MRFLLLHGFTGTPENFTALHAPEGSHAPVLGGHLDQPVVGGFWDEVERLAAQSIGCDGLFGYSLGGRLALGILARYPHRFARAIIVSAQAGLTTEAERSARRQSDAELVTLLRVRGLPAFVERWQALPLWATQAALPEELLQAQREQRLRHNAEGLAQSLLRHGLAEMPDLRSQLASVESRVDLLVGERDEKFVTLGRELASVMLRAHLTIAEGSGHNLVLERPELCSERLLKGSPS